MSFVLGNAGRVLVDDLSWSGFVRGWSFSTQRSVHDVTVLTNTARAYIPGLVEASFELDGLWDPTPDLEGSTYRTSGIVPFSIMPDGITIGNPAYIGSAMGAEVAAESPVDEITKLAVSATISGPLERGVVLKPLSAISSSGSEAGVDNGSSTSGGGRAVLHVTANTRDGGSTLKIEHSSDGSTWSDLMTFAVVPASTTTSESKEVTGTVNRHIRATSTVGGTTGSITHTVSFARR